MIGLIKDTRSLDYSSSGVSAKGDPSDMGGGYGGLGSGVGFDVGI